MALAALALPAAMRATGPSALEATAQTGDHGAQYRLARARYLARDYDAAAQWALRAADGGSAEAEAFYGILLHYGQGVPKDDKAALGWFRRSAAGGCAEGLYRVGWCYAHGFGVEPDDGAAAPYYRRAAALGHTLAAYNLALARPGSPESWAVLERLEKQGSPIAAGALGNWSLLGLGGKPDKIRARRYDLEAARAGLLEGKAGAASLDETGADGIAVDYTRALAECKGAEGLDLDAAVAALHPDYDRMQGVPEDFRGFQRTGLGELLGTLGSIYYYGWGVPVDQARGVRCYRQGASYGNSSAEAELGTACLAGAGTAQDYGAAFHLLTDVAAQGDPPQARYLALLDLGNIYLYGWGVPKDARKAIAYYRVPAEAGVAPAQYDLGNLYLSDALGRSDPDDAFPWLDKAFAGGYVDAAYPLATCYDEGWGVKRDLAKAFAVLKAGAGMGSASAQAQLARYYTEGIGCSKDPDASFRWMLKAAEQGDAEAESDLSTDYTQGKGTSVDQVQAAAWAKKAADQGSMNGEFNLGVLYTSGQGVPLDYGQGMAWYLKAAALGSSAALCNIGVLYDQGLGVAQDYQAARSWYLKADAQGYALGAHNLGYLSMEGHGTPKDLKQAAVWYRRAAKEGDDSAWVVLGNIEENGLAGPADPKGAFADYRFAAEAGRPDGEFLLGNAYLQGRLVPEDDAAAWAWISKAAAQGFAQAQYIAGLMAQQGRGCPEDQARGAALLKASAAQGCEPALRLLEGSDSRAGEATRDIREALEGGEVGGRTAPADAYPLHYRGTIGAKYLVEVSLNRKGDQLSGVYRYLRFPKSLRLEGGLDGSGSFQAVEFDPYGKESGFFVGSQGDDGVLRGLWSKPDGSESFPFVLKPW